MRLITIFFFLLTSTVATFGQLKQKVGQVLITDSLSKFEIKNDSLLDISFNHLWSRYSLKSDTLILEPNDRFEVGLFFGSFKIVTNNTDTLFLLPIKFSKNQNQFFGDTVKFISVKKRITPIKDFKFLRIDQYGTWGSKRLIINQNKTVQFSGSGFYMPNEPATSMKEFTLSEKEYRKIIDTLTNSLITMLPNNKRATHGYDPTFIDISYEINGKRVSLKDLGLSTIHRTVYKYLVYELFKDR